MTPTVELLTDVNGSGIAELVFDDPGRDVNVLGMAAVDELEHALDRLGTGTGVRAIVVRSAKAECFIAGADIREIAAVTEASIAVGHAARVQALLGRLAGLPFPVVAAIRGACLGGGLELALACHHRVAASHPSTRLGLPEVKLGLIPGFGGTQRLPRLVGVRRALGMILKGYNLGVDDALAAGLVDDVLPSEDFEDRVRAWVVATVQAGRPRHRRLALGDRLLASVAPARDLYFRLAERRVKSGTRGAYPAPERALTAMREGLRLRLDEGLEVEAGLVGSLAVSPECKGLIRLYLLSESVKRDPGVDLGLARPVRKAGVLGAGTMGAGIAALLARHAITVRMRDIEMAQLLTGMRRIHRDWRRDRDATVNPLALVSPTLELSGFRRADIVVEAALEEMALKRDLLETMDERLSSEAVFATNTSALSISELQRGSRRPERVVGMHFFHPVARMPLVEVVRGDATSAVAVATVIRLARTLGKVPIVVSDGPGFLVNRVLAPYLMEALLLLLEGVDPIAVESAMLDFGMPMGPLALLDEVGLDVARHVADTLASAFPDRFQPSPLLASMIAGKWLGRKVGIGFYVHGSGKPKPNPGLAGILRRLNARPTRSAPARGVIQERLILPMGNEAMRAIEEGVVRNAGDCDLAMVLGTGFPPFRGGLLSFCDSLGIARFVSSLERLESQHGQRFRPAALVESLARRGLGLLDDPRSRTS